MNTNTPRLQELDPPVLGLALLYAALLIGANLVIGGGLA